MAIVLFNMPNGITLAVLRWNDRPTEKRQHDLTAMGMTGNHQRVWIFDVGKDVRMMGKGQRRRTRRQARRA